MFRSLQKYFILHKKLNLPGIGKLAVEQDPARFDFAEKKIYPPKQIINFYPQKNSADKEFFRFLSEDLDIDEINAVRQFNDFLFEMKSFLSNRGFFTLPGIGDLVVDNDIYSFRPAYNPDSYYSALSIERVIRKNAEHIIRVGENERTNIEMQEMLGETESEQKDYWWVYAILLTVAGVAALVYHFYFRK